jgi:Type IV secretion system pilin
MIPPALLTLIRSIETYIINPLIEVALAVAAVVFLWGVFNFIKGAGDKAAREKGRNHMLWGIIGIAIMLSVFSILTVISNSVGGPSGNISNIQNL